MILVGNYHMKLAQACMLIVGFLIVNKCSLFGDLALKNLQVSEPRVPELVYLDGHRRVSS